MNHLPAKRKFDKSDIPAYSGRDTLRLPCGRLIIYLTDSESESEDSYSEAEGEFSAAPEPVEVPRLPTSFEFFDPEADPFEFPIHPLIPIRINEEGPPVEFEDLTEDEEEEEEEAWLLWVNDEADPDPEAPDIQTYEGTLTRETINLILFDQDARYSQYRVTPKGWKQLESADEQTPREFKRAERYNWPFESDLQREPRIFSEYHGPYRQANGQSPKEC